MAEPQDASVVQNLEAFAEDSANEPSSPIATPLISVVLVPSSSAVQLPSSAFQMRQAGSIVERGVLVFFPDGLVVGLSVLWGQRVHGRDRDGEEQTVGDTAPCQSEPSPQREVEDLRTVQRTSAEPRMQPCSWPGRTRSC